MIRTGGWLLAALVLLALAACTDSAAPQRDTRDTGVPELDVLIRDIEAGDRSALRARLQFVLLPCTHDLGAGGPPKCATEPEATPVDVFRYIACEPAWVREARVDPVLEEALAHRFARFAAYRESGALVAVFAATDRPVVGAGIAVTLQGDRITALRRTCGAGDTARALLPPLGASYLLPPPPP